jgi:DNA mismatch repair protein MutS
MKLTPMFEQYLGIKREYPDALLFYRMGDFYELFFEDAEVAARELQIALTTRNPNAETKVPMCGVPHHSVDAYLSQLLEKGFKVAICDQVEDPRQAKGLVKREVTRVLTPGTVLEDANLEAKRHNYLAALYWDADRSSGGLAWAEFSTGEWSGLQSRKESELWQWARKMQPRELLLPDAYETPPQAAELADDMVQTTRLPGRGAFDQGAARDRLLKAQGVADLSVLDLEDKPELTRACGALLSYLHQTQKRELNHLAPFRPLVLGRHLLLDEVTERNLEIFRRLDGRTGRGTLWKVLDHTLTPMGGRLLQERLRHPWREAGPIQEAQAMTEHFFEADALRGDLRAALDQVYDLERLSTRVFLGRATPKDLVALRRSLDVLPATRSLLSEGTPGRPGSLKNILKHWDDLDDVHALLDASLLDSPPPVITEGGLFKHGFKPELDELLELTEHGEETLRGLLERERQDSGLNKLKLGYNRVFGYYFELPKSQSEDVPYRFIRRQTLANSERFTTPELKELEDKLVAAVDRRKSLEYNLFLELREQVAQARPRLLFMAGVLAGLDFWQSLAEAARRWEWTRPELHAGSEISIQGGRHPVVEAVQGAAHFIPNDLHLDDERKILLITGPNMAGKSTARRAPCCPAWPRRRTRRRKARPPRPAAIPCSTSWTA